MSMEDYSEHEQDNSELYESRTSSAARWERFVEAVNETTDYSDEVEDHLPNYGLSPYQYIPDYQAGDSRYGRLQEYLVEISDITWN